ncbi:FUSC family protein [Enterovibrio norvegicus]|uniref:FUSC family protein n=1 Tax=Enterovibrio norvegicus TaxID=188144 RepID=UPI0013D64D69|nr:FUSC family protein [Enterovibrio norvegicus]
MSQYRAFAIQHTRLFYMIRISFVMTAILLIVRVFELPYGYWALITAVTILGTIPFIGGVLTKANQRVWGTVIGGAVGLALFLVPEQYHWTHHVLFLGALLVAMYFTQEKYAYAALMVAITIVVVAGGGPADFDAATWRILNVVWAAVFSVLSSVFIFPSRATTHFLYMLEQFLQQSAKYYHQHNQYMHPNGNPDPSTPFEPLHADKLSALIDQQQNLLPHVQKETQAHSNLYTNILLIEKRLYADLEALISTHWDAQQGKDKISDMPGLMETKEALALQFQQLAEQVANKSVNAVLLEDISLLQLIPKGHDELRDDDSDISYFGYLWLNREMARQFAHLTEVSSKLFRYQ